MTLFVLIRKCGSVRCFGLFCFALIHEQPYNMYTWRNTRPEKERKIKSRTYRRLYENFIKSMWHINWYGDYLRIQIFPAALFNDTHTHTQIWRWYWRTMNAEWAKERELYPHWKPICWHFYRIKRRATEQETKWMCRVVLAYEHTHTRPDLNYFWELDSQIIINNLAEAYVLVTHLWFCALRIGRFQVRRCKRISRARNCNVHMLAF